MVVTEKNVAQVIEDISREKFVGFDTETYGTHFSDRLFALIISTADKEFYFNFNAEPDHLGNTAEHVLHYEALLLLPDVMLDPCKIWMSHNAIFDVQKLRLEGLPLPTNVHCSFITERILRNDLMDMSLEATAERYGMKKDMRVDEYITKHKLYTQVSIPGKDRRERVPHYNLVPFRMMVEYGSTDARLHREIGIKQLASL